jgi:hypothetical protein
MNVILLLTHKFNELVVRRFELLGDIPGHETIMLADATSRGFPNHSYIHPFRFSDFKRAGYRSLHDRMVPGSCHLPVIEFLSSHNYDFGWCIEFDVVFLGEWPTFFLAHDSSADLLSAQISRPDADPQWHWWRSFRGPRPLDATKLLRSFNPVYRLSRRAALHCKAENQAGWIGHNEVTIPTLLYEKGFHVEDFGGNGEFVRAKNRGLWYNNAIYSYKAIPPLCSPKYHDMLAHPVKQSLEQQFHIDDPINCRRYRSQRSIILSKNRARR